MPNSVAFVVVVDRIVHDGASPSGFPHSNLPSRTWKNPRYSSYPFCLAAGYDDDSFLDLRTQTIQWANTKVVVNHRKEPRRDCRWSFCVCNRFCEKKKSGSRVAPSWMQNFHIHWNVFRHEDLNFRFKKGELQYSTCTGTSDGTEEQSSVLYWRHDHQSRGEEPRRASGAEQTKTIVTRRATGTFLRVLVRTSEIFIHHNNARCSIIM